MCERYASIGGRLIATVKLLAYLLEVVNCSGDPVRRRLGVLMRERNGDFETCE
jgi:hypothetical protein